MSKNKIIMIKNLFQYTKTKYLQYKKCTGHFTERKLRKEDTFGLALYLTVNSWEKKQPSRKSNRLSDKHGFQQTFLERIHFDKLSHTFFENEIRKIQEFQKLFILLKLN